MFFKLSSLRNRIVSFGSVDGSVVGGFNKTPFAKITLEISLKRKNHWNFNKYSHILPYLTSAGFEYIVCPSLTTTFITILIKLVEYWFGSIVLMKCKDASCAQILTYDNAIVVITRVWLYHNLIYMIFSPYLCKICAFCVMDHLWQLIL